jgi:hypothetical protein
MEFERILWYKNVRWIAYALAEYSNKLCSFNSNKILLFTLFFKERPPGSLSNKMSL